MPIGPAAVRYDPAALIGEKLLHYEITARLGEGGMGVVYRATDTRLNREVAIKLLPEAFVEDAERLARFEREAQLLASLNHPNVGGIYGLDEAESRRFLVLELVEGETLAERLARGPMPLGEALPAARQLTLALEAAHARGIVHRDLKPANVKLTPEGQVKVLDFGLAKVWDRPGGALDLTRSPTLTAQMTQAGVILGTASYMSPEQARGQEADKRADIWSFGALLFEMLAGGRLYPGETVTDILGAIVHMEPDWQRLPANLPASIERLLRRCLEKDRQRRLQDVGDARIEIEDAMAAGERAPRRSPAERGSGAGRLGGLMPWLIAAVAVGLAVWAVAGRGGRRPSASPVYARYTVTLPEGQSLLRENGQAVAVSPDGSKIVYVGTEGTTHQLYLREREGTEVRRLPGTEGAEQVTFSPDGRWIAFNGSGAVQKMAVAGGLASRLALQSDPIGLTWGDDGSIFYTPDWGHGIYRVGADGGEPQAVTRLDAEASEGAHLWPEVLPGGGAVLFSTWDTRTGKTSIGVVHLASGEHELLLPDAMMPRYSPTGHLLYVRGETLMAVGFDPERLELQGEPVTIQDGVRWYQGFLAPVYDVSDEGTLVFQAGGLTASQRQLVWVSPEGEVTPAFEDQRPFQGPKISPDGKRVAVTFELPLFEIWIYDLASGTRTQLTRESDNGSPEWTPDGREIVFWSAQVSPYGILRMASDGSSGAEVLHRSEGDTGIPTVSRDGRFLVFEETAGGASSDLMWIDLEGDAGPRPLRQTGADERQPRFSPDGRWIAYQSNESGRREIYVAPFPGPGSSWLISSGGGSAPVWSRDGRRLFYRQGDQLLAVDVATSGGLRAERPRRLFELPGLLEEFDVAPDRDDFLMVRRVEPNSPEESRIQVALGWPARLGDG